MVAILRDDLALQMAELLFVDGDACSLISLVLGFLLLVWGVLTLIVGSFSFVLIVFVRSSRRAGAVVLVTLREEVWSRS